jgi:hypothetical protein
MKVHPFRAAQVGKHILRERMVAEIAKSNAGMRVVRECQAALDLPVNSDPISRKLVLKRFSMELDLLPDELEGLLVRTGKATTKPKLDETSKANLRKLWVSQPKKP